MIKKYLIKVPATSANLGPGFDCIGVSLNLYNTFIVNKENEYCFENVLDEFCNSDNLVIRSAKEVYKYYNVEEIKFKLKVIENVPISRGLGSSATCIIGGIIAAFLLLEKEIDYNVALKIATKIEGHPDNVAPCLLGGLVSSFLNNDEVRYFQYKVNNKIIFNALIPDFMVETRRAREVLPKMLSYESVVYSMSRAINLPFLFTNGDIENLYYACDDMLHQPYRISLIPDSKLFKDFSEKHKLPFMISGSGSTLLILSISNITNDLMKLNTKSNWKYLELQVDNKGCTWEVIND